MVAEHRRQTSEADALVRALGRRDQPAKALAKRIEEIMSRFEADLARGERLLLSDDVLRDDGTVTTLPVG